MKPHRLGKTKRRTMLRCWPTPRLTPTAASVPTAATVSRVLRASISPWSISSMIWPPCSRRSRLRSAPIMRRWNGRLLTVSAAVAARPAVPSMFPWQSGWRRPGRCLRKGNKAVSLLDTKESSGDGKSGLSFLCSYDIKISCQPAVLFSDPMQASSVPLSDRP